MNLLSDRYMENCECGHTRYVHAEKLGSCNAYNCKRQGGRNCREFKLIEKEA